MADDLKDTINKLAREIHGLRSSTDSLTRRIDALQSQVSDMRGQVDAVSHVSADAAPRPLLRIDAIFSGGGTERKPYRLAIDGIVSHRLNLSSIRAAILLVLLLDLQDRSEGGRGVLDPVQSIGQALKLLDADAAKIDDDQLANNMRVAIYRFDVFQAESKLFLNDEFPLRFEPKTCRLETLVESERQLSQDVLVQVTSAHPDFSTLIDELLTSSPLSRLRKQKAIYVPGVESGVDRLLLELYDHNYPVEQVAVLYRPSMQSFPMELLERIKASAPKIERVRLLNEGYKTGRCHFREILPRSALTDLIRLKEDGTFLLYPQNVTADDIQDHLAYIVHLLNEVENYSLTLTDAFAPFHISTFE
ncbi:MAG: hypothetical protein KDD66_14745, partial [Bdellovibrionales bacterium]|nr:hypothetical protein [Bdellovibrionales bacterium]